MAASGGSAIADEFYDADADLAWPFGVIDQADVDAFASAYAEQSVVPIELSDRGSLTVGYAGYHGHELTGFWHARFRWFDPEAGRWLTRDPAGYIDGLSLYLYVGANPLGFIDPLGLCPTCGASVTSRSMRESNQGGYKGVSSAETATGGAVLARLDNAAVGAGAGAATGGATGAAVGGAIGTAFGGIGAAPGAAAGATAGAIGGAITGAVAALLGPADASLTDSATEGAIGGVIDGATAGVGTKLLAGAKAADKGIDLARGADRANGVRQVGEASVDGAGTAGQATRGTQWRAGRYSEAASNPGAYAASGQRVFPTRRNSGLRGQELRAEQQAFVEKRLADGATPDVLRGQAQTAGLTDKVDDGVRKLADPGAEKALQKGIESYNETCKK